MGRPIHTHNAIIRSVQVSKIQNTEQHRSEAARQQFAITLQEEAAHKEKQVQDTHKAEAPEIHKEPENKEKHKRRKKRSLKEHIDLKID